MVLLLKSKNLKKFVLIFFFSYCFLIPYTIANGSYKLGIKLNSDLIYEYSYIDSDLLEKLENEDPHSYSGLSQKSQGSQEKWIIIEILENQTYWRIQIDGYIGVSFRKNAGQWYKFVYKNPASISSGFIWNGTRPNWVFGEPTFIPTNINEYLYNYNQSIPLTYQNITYSTYTQIIFDFTPVNFSDTLIYEFDHRGFLKSFQLFYKNSLAWKLELIKYNVGIDYVLITTIIIVVISTSLISLEIYLIIKRKKRKEKGTENKIH